MKILGCFFSGYLLKIIDRRSLILISNIATLLMNILINCHLNTFTYSVFILIGSYFSGILDPINIDVLCESLPIKFRGFFLCFTYTGFAISTFLQYFLIWCFSKNNSNETNMILVLLINSLLILSIGIFSYFFYDDTARHLIIGKENEKAFQILEKYKKNPLTYEEKKTITKQILKSNEKIGEANLKEIFQGKYLRITILFIFMNVLSNSNSDGMSFVSNDITVENIPGANEAKVSSIGMKCSSFQLFSYLFAGILSETPFLGSKYGLIVCAFFSAFFSFLYLINSKNFVIWIGLNQLIINSYVSLSISFVSESYPTKIRDLSQGFMNSMANLGSLLGQSIYSLLYYHYKSNILMVIGIINGFLMIFVVYFVKQETQDKPLDTIFEEEEKYEEIEENEKEQDEL